MGFRGGGARGAASSCVQKPVALSSPLQPCPRRVLPVTTVTSTGSGSPVLLAGRPVHLQNGFRGSPELLGTNQSLEAATQETGGSGRWGGACGRARGSEAVADFTAKDAAPQPLPRRQAAKHPDLCGPVSLRVPLSRLWFSSRPVSSNWWKPHLLSSALLVDSPRVLNAWGCCPSFSGSEAALGWRRSRSDLTLKRFWVTKRLH